MARWEYVEDDPWGHSPPIDSGPITDDQIEHAIDIVVAAQHASIEYLQERMNLSSLKAHKIMDILEERRVVGPEMPSFQNRYDSGIRVVRGRSRNAILSARARLRTRYFGPEGEDS